MFTIVLFEPEIPPNTGNIIRLCANTGADLHLVKPLGFNLEDKQLKRAGLDYHEYASLKVHENWADCKAALTGKRMFAITTKGSTRHSDIPEEVRSEFTAEHRLRLPMLENSRSLNLSNSAAVLLYEAWRQIGFEAGV
jgi:tRNA (cytidine/uridine-2'-O-)-methyltransferase